MEDAFLGLRDKAYSKRRPGEATIIRVQLEQGRAASGWVTKPKKLVLPILFYERSPIWDRHAADTHSLDFRKVRTNHLAFARSWAERSLERISAPFGRAVEMSGESAGCSSVNTYCFESAQ